jgi:DNA-binding CsgD family transcriptional regulator
MLMTTDRIGKANGIEGTQDSLDAAAKSYLFEALGRALDRLIAGVLIVGDQGRILHVNSSAQEMLDAKSPIISLGGRLCALHEERTKKLRGAIAAARAHQSPVEVIGIPLIGKTGAVATAHVLPLACKLPQATRANAQIPVGVFVMSADAPPPVEIATVAQSFNLTPAESRMLQHLVAGATIRQAAAALGISEATVRTHRNSIFAKTSVSRRSELLLLNGRLVPPIRQC